MPPGYITHFSPNAKLSLSAFFVVCIIHFSWFFPNVLSLWFSFHFLLSVKRQSKLRSPTSFLDLVAGWVGRRQRVRRVHFIRLSCRMHNKGWGVPPVILCSCLLTAFSISSMVGWGSPGMSDHRGIRGIRSPWKRRREWGGGGWGGWGWLGKN